MVRGGVAQIADSRLDNLARIRRDGITVPLMLIRAPSLNEIDDTIRYADISLNSELTTIVALGRAALTRGVIHDIVLMIDLGDLREGILPAEALDVVAEILPIEGIRLIGIGANLACVGGIQPTVDNLSNLVYIADEITKRFSIELPIVSGGNTFSLPLLETGTMPEGINHLRLGASIVLARITYSPRTVRTAEQRCLHSHRGHHRGQGQAVAAVWSLRGRRIRPTPPSSTTRTSRADA